MADFITLSCPSCGNKLHITSDIDRFACAACGNEHVVNRTGGIISLKPVIDGINGVKISVDKTASELAIVRLKKEIEDLEYHIYSVIDSINSSKGTSGTGRKRWAWVFMVLFIGLAFGLRLAIHDSTRSPAYDAPYLIPLLTFGVIISLVISITLFVSSSSTNKLHTRFLDKQLNEKIPPLQNKLKAKKEELAGHQAIVSKYK